VEWKALARQAFTKRHRLKQWWVPPLVLALLIVDAATLASGSLIGSVLWPSLDDRSATLIWKMPAYRVHQDATLRGGDGATPIAWAEYRQESMQRPLWAPTSFSPGAISIVPTEGETLTRREASQIASEMRTVIARRLGPSAHSIPTHSRQHPIDARGVLGIIHNMVTIVVVAAGLYATPSLLRAARRVRDRINAALVPRTRGEKRQDKLRAGVCPGCGYDVRGLLENQCPECGGLWHADEHVLIPPIPGHELTTEPFE
jgi:hypothetical protein